MKKLLIIGAHSGDFVWRAAGTIARALEEGAETLVVALSYGERGESGELWKEDPKRSVESVKIIRHEQAQKAADILGTPIRFFDWGDYPMLLTDERVEQLTNLIGDFEPTVILTHSEKDPFNPDHPLAFQAVHRARLLSSGAGVPSAFKNIDPPAWYSFEPHQPELCGFVPDTFIDITSVMEKNGPQWPAWARKPTCATTTPNWLPDAPTMPGGFRGKNTFSSPRVFRARCHA